MSIGAVNRTHLGDRTAAFVDGRLDAAGESAARRHLDRCVTCEAAVRAQRLLKWRMSALAAAPVAPPDSLLGRLAELGDQLAQTPSCWPGSRTSTAPAASAQRRHRLPHVLLAAGLSALVVAGAYAVAPSGTPPAVDRGAGRVLPTGSVVPPQPAGSALLQPAVHESAESAWSAPGTPVTAVVSVPVGLLPGSHVAAP